jgi:hypothetical protein
MDSIKYGKNTPEGIKAECKRIYLEEYVQKCDGTKILLSTSDGFHVSFSEEQFEHAFSREDEKTKIRRFDFTRARKVKWIGQVIKERCDGLTLKKADIEKKGIKQRIYYLPERSYLVVLNWDETCDTKILRFETAYFVDLPYKFKELNKIFSEK